MSGIRRAAIHALSVAALAVGGVAAFAVPALADTAPPAGTPATVSADPLPTWQINGIVWAQVTVGNIVYATGQFSSARPPGSAAGQNEVARGNLLAYDITTGNLITSFNHTLNAQGLAITRSPDGTRVYVAGDFTKVDNLTHNRIAAFDTATGALVDSFRPSPSGSVKAITATNSTVYAGGTFGSVSGQTRTNLAAWNAAGSLLSWAPAANAGITAMVMSPDQSRVMIGGRFTSLGGASRYGFGPVDPTTGLSVSWPANFIIRNAGNNSSITSLVADANYVYITGYVFGSGGNFEGRAAVNANTGVIAMLDDCHGDTYDTFPMGGVLYSVSHSHDCSNIGAFPNQPQHYFALADTIAATGVVKRNTVGNYYNYQGQPAPTQLVWYPSLKSGDVAGQAAWTVTGNGTYLALGGEFPTVNGVAQQGLVRFALRANAPNKVGPRSSDTLTPKATAAGAGQATVTWQTTWDYDNSALTYRVYRDADTAPVETRTVDSRFWSLPNQTYTDSGLATGSHTYTVTATDPLGNVRTSAASAPVNVVGGTNSPPTARFTGSCTGLQCSVDGTTSSDTDGTITGYAWNFGDGGTASTATAQHTYANPGTYTVTLTVTDNGGARSAVQHDLTATAGGGGGAFASDTFNRTVSGGWGTADQGGQYSSVGSASGLSVVPGAGRITLAAPSASSGAYLGATPAASSDVTLSLSFDKIASGGGAYVYVLGRHVTNTAEYRGSVKIDATGQVTLSFSKLDGSSSEVSISTKLAVPGLVLSAGTVLNLRMQVEGSGTTTLRLKAWTGATEPGSFQITTTDSSANLQAPGTVGVRGYLSGSAGNAPVVVSVTTLRATAVAP